MTIARSRGALLGTNEGTGVTVAAGTTTVGAVTDVLGDDTSTGVVGLFVAFTPPASGASVRLEVKLIGSRGAGTSYTELAADKVVATGGVTVNQRVYLGRFAISRYMAAEVRNAETADVTNVSVLFELEKTS